MEHVTPSQTRFGALWQSFTAALVTLARKCGCSLRHNPMPEIREAARDWVSETA
jgi:hypothetical protein